MTPSPMTMLVGEEYLAELLTEELCGDGALSDLKVKAISQSESGVFQIVMAPKKDEAK